MKHSSRSFLAIMGLAVGGSLALYVFRGMAPLPTDVQALIAPVPVEVTIASSVTKQKWLEAAAVAFKASDVRTAAGAPIDIKIKAVLSGDSMLEILGGKLQPVVWSPGENTWVAQFQDQWQTKSGRPAMSEVLQAHRVYAHGNCDVAADGRSPRLAVEEDRLENPD